MLKDEYSTDYVKLKEMQDEIQDLNEQIDKKMQEWEDLNEKLTLVN